MGRVRRVIWWPVIESIYFVLGSCVAMATTNAHAARLRIHDTGFDHAAAFIIVFGTITLWPVLVLLAIDEVRNK
jgi:hypothetical protein